MPTQCLLFDKLNEQSFKGGQNHEQLCENLLEKVNEKLGGINTRTNPGSALKLKNLKANKYMFFGADVIHSTNCKQ
ncbi:unnamed protein product [Didymodactylos carnosus]|uniref:Piwi domain-containing protein n=1 Tax=Didymodactylos carnosus TaxID=1234261 RepID=A0A815A7C5_9BILA|nr:unnamed protein product [Didymodactylos carnosus]CAF4024513.1 unnamed protein product [Didymodactylos carnosus]